MDARFDDLSLADLEHRRKHRLRAEKRSREVDREHPVPVLLGMLEEALDRPHPRIVDENVDTAILAEYRLRHCIDTLRPGHVDLDRGGRTAAAANSPGDAAGAVDIEIGDDHGCAFGSERDADGLTDAPSTAGDESHLSCELHALVLLGKFPLVPHRTPARTRITSCAV